MTICQFTPYENEVFRTNVQLGENKMTHRGLRFTCLFTYTAMMYQKAIYSSQYAYLLQQHISILLQIGIFTSIIQIIQIEESPLHFLFFFMFYIEYLKQLL